MIRSARMREARAVGTEPANAAPWREVGAVAFLTVLLSQSLRAFVPLVYGLREGAGVPLAAAIALTAFLGPLGGLAFPRAHLRFSVAITVFLAAALRIAVQSAHPIPLALSAATTFATLVALTQLVQICRLRGDAMAPVWGLLVGLTMDTAIRGAFATWDPVWQTGPRPFGIAAALSTSTIVLMWTSLRPEPATGRVVLPALGLAALGPVLFLELLFLQNIAFIDATAGVSMPVGTAVALGGGIVAVVAAAVSLRLSDRARWVAGASLILLSWLLVTTVGIAIAASVIAAQACLGALVSAALAPAPRAPTGTRSMPVTLALSLGTVLFAVLIFLYQIDAERPLPISNVVLPPVAALLLGILTSGRTTLHVRPPRGIAVASAAGLIVPLVMGLTWDEPIPASATQRITLLDWNVHSAIDAGGQLRPDALADAIARAAPDVVVLQEVPRGWPIAAGIDLAEWLSRRLDMRFAWAPAADPQFGNAILSRIPFDNVQAVTLPYGAGPQRRSYLRVELATGSGEAVAIIGTHLQNTAGTGTRSAQIRAILDEIEPEMPTVIAGDLNAQPGEADIELLRRAGLRSAQDATGNAERSTARDPASPGDRVDWIFATRELRFGQDFEIAPQDVSDHLPIVVTIEVVAEPQRS